MKGLFFLFLIISFCSMAQVTMEDFLLGAFDEPALQSFTAQENFLNTKSYRAAPIQKLEFRTGSNQLDRTRQDYALRINPANPLEMRRNNQYFMRYQELIQLDHDRVLKESLHARYEVIIGWLYFQEMLKLKEEDKKTTETLLSILEGQRFSGFFDAEDYVELKMDQVDRTIELEETYFEIDNQRRKIEALFTKARLKNIDWPMTSVISIDGIEVLVDSVWQQEVRAGEVAYRKKQIDLANSEWKLEKSNINVGYFQTQYQPWREEQGRNPWSISLGVTIPVFNPNKGDMAKRKLEVLEAEGEFDVAKNEQLAGRELSREKIKNLIKRHAEVYEMIGNLNVGSLAATVRQIKDNNPMGVVRVEKNLIKLKVTAARLRQEIYLTFLEFLHYSEVLQQTPLINYLSSNPEPLAGN